MKQVVTENPVINSPFEEPKRHLRFSEEGITNEILEARRVSSYFVFIAKPKKKGKQKQLSFELQKRAHSLLAAGLASGSIE
jgi:type III restriction enzyme